MGRLLRLLRWALVLLVVLVVAVTGGGYLWLRAALPQTSGAVTLRGIGAPVELLRDARGVPHIRAAGLDDALFGLGYAHAQDRLWQMEFQRRIGYGRLSEVLGPATIEEDRFLRTLGTGRAALSAWGSLGPEARGQIEAYVAGVNAFLSSHRGRQLPVEFTLLGFEPQPWRPEDVLLWVKMMSWNLSGNWEEELLQAQLRQKFDTATVGFLMPGSLPEDPVILPASAAAAFDGAPAARRRAPPACARVDDCAGLLAVGRLIERSLGLGGQGVGSNNWVVGGARTTTGKPLLANDPHLGAQLPSIWYLAHIQGGPVDAIGATLPGVPGVVIGHNRRIAWGVTNTGPDVQDLFIERVDERDRAEYNGRREPLQIIDEVIKVKGQPDISLRVRVSRHGPLISDVMDDATDPVAFRWTALDEQDRTFEAFLKINAAGDWREFTEALRSYHTPMQNFVYADVDGNIGYYAPGALPVRTGGDGSAPVPGWTDAYDWAGYVPFEELPHAYNPPEGFIASANNRAVPEGYPHLVTSSWAMPYRAERIRELIEATPRLSPDNIASMQADVESVQARRLLPHMLAAQPASERGRAAIELLRGWDGHVQGGSAQAAIYEAWLLALPSAVFSDELGQPLFDEYAQFDDQVSMALFAVLDGRGGVWCDDTATPAPEGCPATLGRALERGLEQMAAAQHSDDMAGWHWDRVHHTLFPHQVFDSVGQLRAAFSRQIPNGGDDATVNVAPVGRGIGYNQSHVPSYRQIIDMADLDGSRFIHGGGQSGQLLSGHYDDLIAPWQRVEYLPMPFSAAAVDTSVRDRLVLRPAP